MTSQEQNRLNLEFEVTYSYCYEKIMYKFLARIDKLLSFFLLLFSMSAIVMWSNGVVLGIFVAIITSLQLIYSPSTQAQAAKDCCYQYYKLYKSMNTMSDEEIKSSLISLAKNDTSDIIILSHSARLSALAMLGMTPDKKYPQERKLKPLEYLAALFAGELPEYDFKQVAPESNNDIQN